MAPQFQHEEVKDLHRIMTELAASAHEKTGQDYHVEIIRYARANPKDARLPEPALALVQGRTLDLKLITLEIPDVKVLAELTSVERLIDGRTYVTSDLTATFTDTTHKTLARPVLEDYARLNGYTFLPRQASR